MFRHALDNTRWTAELKESVMDKVVQPGLNERCDQLSEVFCGQYSVDPKFGVHKVHKVEMRDYELNYILRICGEISCANRLGFPDFVWRSRVLNNE